MRASRLSKHKKASEGMVYIRGDEAVGRLHRLHDFGELFAVAPVQVLDGVSMGLPVGLAVRWARHGA